MSKNLTRKSDYFEISKNAKLVIYEDPTSVLIRDKTGVVTSIGMEDIPVTIDALKNFMKHKSLISPKYFIHTSESGLCLELAEYTDSECENFNIVAWFSLDREDEASELLKCLEKKREEDELKSS